MNTRDFIDICKELICNDFNTNADKSKGAISSINHDNVYVVWICKTLQNVKALLSTDVPDGMYYEMTYNGDLNEIYFDAYKKWKNIRYVANASQPQETVELGELDKDDAVNEEAGK